MKLSSLNSFSSGRKVNTVRQNKKQYSAAPLSAQDSISFSGRRKKSTSALASLLALLSLLTACNSKPNDPAQSSSPSSSMIQNDASKDEQGSSFTETPNIIFGDDDETYVVVDDDSTEEKDAQAASHQVQNPIPKPTKTTAPQSAAQTPGAIENVTSITSESTAAKTEGSAAVPTAPTAPSKPVPPITYPIIDTKEMLIGYTPFVHAKADELMKDITSVDEKVQILRDEAAILEAEAAAFEAEAKEAQEKLEAAWTLFYTTGEGSKEDLDSQVMHVAGLRAKAEQSRRYAEGLNKVADEVANGTYVSTSAQPPLPPANNTPTAPTAPTMAVPPITYPIIDTIEMIGGYTQHIHAKADELMKDITSVDEKVAILRQEAASLEAEALIAEIEAKEAQEELEAAWTLFYTTGEGSKEDLDDQIMFVAGRRTTAERNRRYAEGLNKVADEVANGTYKSTNPQSPPDNAPTVPPVIDGPTAPTAPTMAVPPIVYPCIDSAEDFSGYTRFVHAKADELIDGVTSANEKVQILRDEAARLEAEAIAAEAEAKELQEELEAAWTLFYTTGEGSKEDLDNMVTSVGFLRKRAEKNRKYAEGLNHVADLVANGTYQSSAKPPMPY